MDQKKIKCSPKLTLKMLGLLLNWLVTEYIFINFTFLSPAILFQINVIGELSRFRQTYDAFVALWRVISISLLHNFDIIDIMNKPRMYWRKEFSKNVKSHAICWFGERGHWKKLIFFPKPKWIWLVCPRQSCVLYCKTYDMERTRQATLPQRH